jgi:rhodanese-related sulfurtransferase
MNTDTVAAASTALSTSPALRVPPAAPEAAAAFFLSRLAFQADVSDVRASLASGDPGFVLIDSRASAGWQQGHVPGAVHLPTAEIPARAAELLDPNVPVITYCWGPGCDGATRAALALAQLGYQVKEMIGGIEYWIREGFPVETAAGTEQRPADPLTAPIGGITCAC